MKKWIFVTLLLMLTLLAGEWQAGQPAAIAQTSSTATALIEDFANGFNPPRLNSLLFNHSFTLGTAWDLGGSTLGEPLSQTPPFALTLYAGNEDRVTFNQPSSFSYVREAQVWGWTLPAQNGLAAGRGRIVFEGSGDEKTFTFVGGARQWKLFKATATDLGDNGLPLGEIVAVRLADTGNNGVQAMFDDLEVVSVTPPRRADLTLTMTGSASAVTPSDTLSYELVVTNNGPQSAPNVTVENVMPFGGTFVANGSASACGLALGQVRCNLGTLAVGASRTVTLQITVGNDACATLTNRATVTAQAFDSDMTSNTAVHTATTSNPACADFAVTQTALPVPPQPGEDALTYTLTARNNGPDTSDGSLTFTLPTHVAFDSVLADSGVTCTPAGSDVNCTLPALVAGQQKQILVTGNALATMSGMQISRAQITSNIDDPAPDNNRSLFRFTADPAYSYTIIGELGVGALANFDRVGGVALNNNGEVAFHVSDGFVTNASEFAIFRGAGSGPLVTITHSSDYPALPADQYRQIGILGEVDLNDAGVVVFIQEESRQLTNGHETISSTVRTGSGGGLSTIAFDSEASGSRFRRYDLATIDNWGRVAAAYRERFGDSAVVMFDGGQESLIIAARSRDYVMSSVGISTDSRYIAHQESPVLGLGSFYTLGLAFPGGSGIQLAQAAGSVSNAIFVHPHIGISDTGGVIYSHTQIDPLSAQEVEELRIGNRVLLSGLGLPNFNRNFGMPKLNNDHRYVFESSFTSQFGTRGLFTGPHPVANRVVRASVAAGDQLFGSRATSLMGSFALDINDSGQVAFAVELANGRILILRADPSAEVDQDGVNDWTELGAPNQGDGNNDGIPDSAQPHVAATTNLDGSYRVTFAVDPNYTLGNVSPIPNPSPGNAPNASFSLGYFSLEVRDLDPGAAAQVEVTLPGWVVVQSWWKYGRTAANPTRHWYEFAFDGVTGAEINGNVVTLHFVDGQRGDDDLAANGVIVDPGGPAAFPETVFLPVTMRR